MQMKNCAESISITFISYIDVIYLSILILHWNYYWHTEYVLFIILFWDNIYYVKMFRLTCINEYTNSIDKWVQRCRKSFIDYCFPKTSYIMHDNRNVTRWIQNIHPILVNEHEQKLQDVWASFVLFDLCYVCSFI